MRRATVAVAFVLIGALVSAQDPPAGQRPAVPPGAQPVPVRPIAAPLPPRPIMAPSAGMAQLEEELETLEATLDVKKAHVKAAEVSVDASKARHDLISRAAAGAQISELQALTARFDFEQAKAQLAIRQAEVKEVEVKVEYAKKRLDDAKLGGVRPGPVAPR